MNGLNYFKNKPDVFAKEDTEYPDWLWDLLGDSSKQEKKSGGVDPSSMSLSASPFPYWTEADLDAVQP